MATNPVLYLHEEILLLALRDKKGTIEPGSSYAYAIGGAVLAELMLRERIDVETIKKRHYARVLSSATTTDPILDECLNKIRQAKRRATLQTWVARFATLKDLKHRLARQLCRRGILRADEDKVLLVFKRRIYPEIDPLPERKLRERIDRAIFSDASDIDPRTVVLVSIANGAGLLRGVVDNSKLKARQKRIAELAAGELSGKATKEAIQAMEAAVLVAAVLPAILASTTTH